jgi:hypothetical protein
VEQRAQKLDSEQRRRQAETEARRKLEAEEQAERERLTTFWASLSPSEQAAVQAEALASANSFFLSQYLRHRGRDLEQERRYLKLILDCHLASLLEKQREA